MSLEKDALKPMKDLISLLIDKVGLQIRTDPRH